MLFCLRFALIYPTRGDNVMELAMSILEKRKYKKENLLSSALVTADNANVLLMQDEELERQGDNLLSLRKKVETTTNAFDTQRSYLFMLLFLVVLLIIACMLALKAYMAKTRYNRQLKDSMQKQKEMTEDYDSNRPLILVIDDNESMRTYLKGILHAKYKVIEAQNGEEGLKIARKTVPQLVVSDVMMPVMDGMEFCSRMKEDVTTCHIPVILLTAKSLEEQRIEGYNKGADSYITKPFTAETLVARIDNLLKNRLQLRRIFSGSSLEEQEQEALGEKDRTFIAQLRKAIKKHIPDADYSVEDLGEEMGLSRVQLYRNVKALTGYSVVDLLRKARLAKAKQLLETTEKNISEVAYDVGFTTPSYFTKCFKEEYGMNPGDVGK